MKGTPKQIIEILKAISKWSNNEIQESFGNLKEDK